MSIERIFYLTAQELTVFQCDKGTVRRLDSYPPTVEGVSAFDAYLAQHPRETSALLLDLFEEEFRHETIPHLLGGDRQSVLNRKLDNLFRRTPYRGAQFQGRERAGKRHDRVLCTAVTNPEAVSIWLPGLQQYRVPFKGIYSVPFVVQKLLEKLRLKQPNTLLLSLQQGGLLRQSFFSDGVLKISRLSLLPAFTPQEYLATVLKEVDKNYRYLNRIQLLPFNQPMDVSLLGAADLLEVLRAGCEDSPTQRYHFIDINQAADRLELDLELNSGQSEWLYAALLGRHTPALNYAPQADRRYFIMRQAKRQLLAASVLLAVGAAAWGVNNIIQAQRLKGQGHVAHLETEQLQRRYEQAKQAMPAVPLPPRLMQSAVEISEALARHQVRPAQVLGVLSRGLADHPQVVIEELRWGVTQSRHAEIDDDGMAMATNPEEAEEGSDPAGGASLFQVASMKARLDPFAEDYREAFTRIDQLMQALRAQPEVVEVSAVLLPLNVDPSAVLAGESGISTDAPSAMFEIKTVMKVAADEV